MSLSPRAKETLHTTLALFTLRSIPWLLLSSHSLFLFQFRSHFPDFPGKPAPLGSGHRFCGSQITSALPKAKSILTEIPLAGLGQAEMEKILNRSPSGPCKWIIPFLKEGGRDAGSPCHERLGRKLGQGLLKPCSKMSMP